MLHISAAGAMKNEARACGRRKHGSAKKRAQAAWIMQGEIERIVDNGLLALCANIGGNRFGYSEQHQRVVDQVRGQVHEDTGPWTAALSPGIGLEMRTKAIVVRFKSHDPAESSLGNDLADRLKIAIEAPVVIHGQQAAALVRKLS